MEERSLMSATFAAEPVEPVSRVGGMFRSAIQDDPFFSAPPLAGGGMFRSAIQDDPSPISVAEDVIVDGRIITAPDLSKGSTPNLVRFNSHTPGTSSVADDVIVDGRIITAPIVSSHELGHALGFRHEHVRPTALTSGTYGRGVYELFLNDNVRKVGTGTIVLNNSNDAPSWGNDVLFGGTGQDGTSANADSPYQGKRSTGGYVPT